MLVPRRANAVRLTISGKIAAPRSQHEKLVRKVAMLRRANNTSGGTAASRSNANKSQLQSRNAAQAYGKTLLDKTERCPCSQRWRWEVKASFAMGNTLFTTAE